MRQRVVVLVRRRCAEVDRVGGEGDELVGVEALLAQDGATDVRGAAYQPELAQTVRVDAACLGREREARGYGSQYLGDERGLHSILLVSARSIYRVVARRARQQLDGHRRAE